MQNDLRVQGQAQTGGGVTVSGGTPEPQVANRPDMENPGTSDGAAGTTVGSAAGGRRTGQRTEV